MLIRTNGVVKGSYNLQTGLERYRQSIAQVQKSSTGVGAGGIDIICYGDSIIEGFNSADPTFDSAIHYLKVKLQEKYNPSGVIGGYGFFPSSLGGGNNSPYLWTTFGTVGMEGGPYSIKGMGRGGQGAAGTGNGLSVRLNGANPAYYRTAADAIQILGIKHVAYGTDRWDIGVGSLPAIGAGSITGTHNHFNSGGATYGGLRFGTALEPSFTNKITLTPSNDNYLRWATPTDTGKYGSIDGVIAYNGDFTCGVRLHNLGYFGKKLSDQISFVKDQQGSGTNGTFVMWGQGLKTGGACNAKLYIMDWITNDCGFGSTPSVTLTSFQTQYAEAVDYILSLASKPSVLLVIPPKRTDNGNLIGARTTVGERWEDFRDAIFAIAFSRSNVAVLDLNAYFNDSSNAATGQLADAGWYDDGVHFSDGGQKAWGELMFKILTAY
jgi:lysophospholipase L1-like esterase